LIDDLNKNVFYFMIKHDKIKKRVAVITTHEFSSPKKWRCL